MDVLKVIIAPDGTALIRCPGCGREKVVPTSRLKSKFKFKVKCPCSSVFAVQLEFRRRFRKATDLEAYFEKLRAQDRWGKIHWQSSGGGARASNCMVKNVSAHGIGVVPGASHDLHEGDFIQVRFTLDNSAATPIEKKAVVRSAATTYLGCEFLDEDKDDKHLGFYLL